MAIVTAIIKRVGVHIPAKYKYVNGPNVSTDKAGLDDGAQISRWRNSIQMSN